MYAKQFFQAITAMMFVVAASYGVAQYGFGAAPTDVAKDIALAFAALIVFLCAVTDDEGSLDKRSWGMSAAGLVGLVAFAVLVRMVGWPALLVLAAAEGIMARMYRTRVLRSDPDPNHNGSPARPPRRCSSKPNSADA